MKTSFNDRLYTCIVTVIMIIIAIIAIIPLLNVIALSLSSKWAVDKGSVTLFPVGLTLDSWKYIICDSGLWRSALISLSSTIIGVFLSLALTIITAYPLSKREFALARILMIYVVGTMIFKAPIVPNFLVLRGYGLCNNYWVLILPFILSAYNMAIMRTSFKQFPREIEEAATIDGCSIFGTLFRVVLPSSKASIVSVGLFYGVSLWNQYKNPAMFINRSALFPLQMRIHQLILSGSSDFDVAGVVGEINYTSATLSAATIVFAIIPVIAVYPWLQKYFAQGAMLGSVKG